MARLPKGKGRAWVALHTTMLNDTDLLLTGNAARVLAPVLLLWSAEQGTDGVLPSDPRKVQLVARLDGGVDEVRVAIAALLDIEFVVDNGDGTMTVRNWAKFQADFGGSSTRADSVRTFRFKKAHEDGKHADAPREGCELCAGAVEAPQAAPVAVVEPSRAVAEVLSASELRARVWDRCDKALALAEDSGADPLDAYLAVYEDAVAASEKYADVKGVGDATLPNTVITHAAHTYLTRDGIAPSDGLLRSLHGLRKEHGADVLTKLPAAGQARSPLAYVKGCYKAVTA